jgi:hypothetical protein
MRTNEYKNALAVAEGELARLDAKAEVIAHRRAQLLQTIAALKTLMNIEEADQRTLTDSIRIVVQAANGYLSAADVLRGVVSMGATFSGKNPIASIVTILGRLVKDGELERQRGTIKARFRARTGARR